MDTAAKGKMLTSLRGVVAPWMRGLNVTLQVSGGVIVVIGAALPWVMLPLGPLPVPVSGLLAGAMLVFLCGAGIVAYYAWKRQTLPPIATIVLACVIVMVTLHRLHDIPGRTKYWLSGLEMKLYPINQLLIKFQLPEIRFTDWGRVPADFLGVGLFVTLIGAVAILLGVLLQITEGGLFKKGLTMGLLGRGACRGCGSTWSIQRSANFCPHCGVPISGTLVCKCCGTQARAGDLFCVKCGERFEGITH